MQKPQQSIYKFNARCQSLPFELLEAGVSVSICVSDSDLLRFPFLGEMLVSFGFTSELLGFPGESFFDFEMTSSMIGLRFPVSSLI